MPRILIIGIAVVDAIARPVEALPSPGGLRFFDDLTFTTGGCAVNCAIALSKLGVAVNLVARVGQDPLGDFVIAELTRAGVSSSHVIRDPVRSTSFSFVAVPSGGDRAFLHTRGSNATLCPADIPQAILGNSSTVFVTGTMLMDALDGEPAANLLASARSRGAVTLMDTVYVEGLSSDVWKQRVMPALPHLDYFIPSEAEARALTGHDDPLAAAKEFLAAGARHVVIKLGSRGVLAIDENGRDTLVPAFPVPRVVDATGAGDCWAAGFIAGLHQGLDLVNASRMGNAVASISVQSAGATTGLHTLEQVTALLRQ